MTIMISINITLWYNKFILINAVKYDIYILYTSKFN